MNAKTAKGLLPVITIVICSWGGPLPDPVVVRLTDAGRTAVDGAVAALSTTCTHLGCLSMQNIRDRHTQLL